MAGIESRISRAAIRPPPILGPVRRSRRQVTIGKQGFAERCALVEGNRLRRTQLGPEQSAIGAIDIAAAERYQPPGHSDEARDRGTGIVLADRKHVQDDVGGRIAQAGGKVEYWD